MPYPFLSFQRVHGSPICVFSGYFLTPRPFTPAMSLRHTPLQFANGIARILSITRVTSQNRAARRNAKKRTPIGRLLPQRRKTRDCRFAAKRRNAVLTSHTFRSPQTDVARTISCQFTKPSGSPQRQKKDAHRTSFFWRRRRDSNSCYGFPILLP